MVLFVHDYDGDNLFRGMVDLRTEQPKVIFSEEKTVKPHHCNFVTRRSGNEFQVAVTTRSATTNRKT